MFWNLHFYHPSKTTIHWGVHGFAVVQKWMWNSSDEPLLREKNHHVFVWAVREKLVPGNQRLMEWVCVIFLEFKDRIHLRVFSQQKGWFLSCVLQLGTLHLLLRVGITDMLCCIGIVTGLCLSPKMGTSSDWSESIFGLRLVPLVWISCYKYGIFTCKKSTLRSIASIRCRYKSCCKHIFPVFI